MAEDSAGSNSSPPPPLLPLLPFPSLPLGPPVLAPTAFSTSSALKSFRMDCCVRSKSSTSRPTLKGRGRRDDFACLALEG
jgi:hypothetical protein